METKTKQRIESGIWNKTVHATFKKVIAFDMLCIGIGVPIGMGVGAYLLS